MLLPPPQRHTPHTHQHTISTSHLACCYIADKSNIIHRTHRQCDLVHGDRIVIGNHHFFRVNIPSGGSGAGAGPRGGSGTKPTDIRDFRYAKRELEQVQAARLQEELERERERVQVRHAGPGSWRPPSHAFGEIAWLPGSQTANHLSRHLAS